MAFKPTHYGKLFWKYSTRHRWAYSGNWGQWRKLQKKVLVVGRFGMSWYRWVNVSQAWEPSPGRKQR